VNKGLDGKDSL